MTPQGAEYSVQRRDHESSPFVLISSLPVAGPSNGRPSRFPGPHLPPAPGRLSIAPTPRHRSAIGVPSLRHRSPSPPISPYHQSPAPPAGHNPGVTTRDEKTHRAARLSADLGRISYAATSVIWWGKNECGDDGECVWGGGSRGGIGRGHGHGQWSLYIDHYAEQRCTMPRSLGFYITAFV